MNNEDLLGLPGSIGNVGASDRGSVAPSARSVSMDYSAPTGLESNDSKQRFESVDAKPDFSAPRENNLNTLAGGQSLFVENDDDEYIDSDELSDELFRSVEAFSSDDDDAFAFDGNAALLDENEND